MTFFLFLSFFDLLVAFPLISDWAMFVALRRRRVVGSFIFEEFAFVPVGFTVEIVVDEDVDKFEKL